MQKVSVVPANRKMLRGIGLFVIIQVTLLSHGLAQDNYFSLCFGSNKAFGSFAKSNNLLTQGYATNGFMATYSGAFYVNKNIGIAGNLGFNTNLIEAEKAEDALAQFYTETIPENTNSTLNLGQWNQVTLNSGPQITLRTASFAFDFFVLVGFDIIFAPNLDVKWLDVNGGEIFHTRLETSAARPSFDTGFGIRYLFNDKSGIRVFVSYIQSGTKGELLIDKDLGSVHESVNYKTKIQILVAGIGLVYRI